MTDDQFRSLCNVYGFAPSRSLRELLDTAVAQARIAEREACAQIVEELPCECCWGEGAVEVAGDYAAAIRKRGQA